MMNGAQVKGNTTEFRVWAPKAKKVTLRLQKRGEKQQDLAMEPSPDGVYRLTTDARAGDRYFYLLHDDPLQMPDPVSRLLPEGVHGRTEIVDPAAYQWHDQDWQGILYRDYVIYELHVGTFTESGTFESAIEKLDYLKGLGITAIEIMPVAAFPGKHNWGYDGVSMYAVQDSYGGPEGLKRLVDAAHEKGIAVIMDAVYNHVGNEGNYLSRFGPYFTSKHKTPWGDAINYDDKGSDHVRNYIVENALYWIDEYHIDGLRFDAIHTIQDDSKTHIMAEIRDEVQRYATQAGRTVCLMAETDENISRYVRPREQGGFGLDGLWSDDFHHAIHTLATGEKEGYYQDFGEPEQLIRALNEGFVFQGEPFEFWGRKRGESSQGVPAEAHVVCIQNHDQVGNRALGERLTHLVSRERRMVMAALLLLSPGTPLIFMGEESDETAPFQFFTDYGDPVLKKAVSEGRRNEFKHFKSFGSEFPDPQDPATFKRSKLNWQFTPERQDMVDWYRQLLALRKWVYGDQPRSCRAQLVGDMIEINIPAEQPKLLLRASLSGAELPSPIADWCQAIQVHGDDAQLQVWMPQEAAEQFRLLCA